MASMDRYRTRDGYQPPTREEFRPPVRESYQEPAKGPFQAPIRESYQPPARESYQPPVRESYQPPSRESYQPPTRENYQPPSASRPRVNGGYADRRSSRSPTKRSPTKRRDIPPAAPSPPTHASRTSPPRPRSGRSAPSPATLRSPAQAATPARPERSQWYFTPDELRASPSIVDGMPLAEERLRRAKGVNFILQAAQLLDLPVLTIWVASVFFHRFYMRHTMVESKGGIHHYNIAATALFLANKTEENCKKTKDLIVAVAKVAQKDPNLIIDEQSKEYWRWRDSILMHEEMMLEMLTFDLMVENPYNVFFGSLLPRMGLEHNKPLRKSAWTFCNDAALTPMALVYSPREIAIAAIFFATSVTGEKIEDGPNGEPWWRMLGANEERTVQATSMLLDFYVENPLRKLETKGQGSPEFNLDATRRRGDTLLSQTDAGSSQTVTPFATDRGETLSPRVRVNGRGDHEGDKSHSRTTSDEAAFAVADANLARGDSDEVLKAAANDLDAHQGHANGDGVGLPVKRKSPDASEVNGERKEKRTRLD